MAGLNTSRYTAVCVLIGMTVCGCSPETSLAQSQDSFCRDLGTVLTATESDLKGFRGQEDFVNGDYVSFYSKFKVGKLSNCRVEFEDRIQSATYRCDEDALELPVADKYFQAARSCLSERLLVRATEESLHSGRYTMTGFSGFVSHGGREVIDLEAITGGPGFLGETSVNMQQDLRGGLQIIFSYKFSSAPDTQPTGAEKP